MAPGRREAIAALGMLSMRMGAAFVPSACRPRITRASCKIYLADLHQIQPRRAPRLARIGAGAVSMLQRDEGQDAVEPFAYEGLEKNPVARDPVGYAGALAIQLLPLLGFNDRYGHWLFFLGLATSSVYLGSGATPLVPPEAAPLSMQQALLAPFLGAGTLGALYYCITVLHIDPTLAYRVGTTLFAAFAGSLLFRDALLAFKADLSVDTADKGGGIMAAAIAGTYLAGAGTETLFGVAGNNFLAFSLCLLSIRSVPLRSFAVGGALLLGLFFYDIYFVFGSDVMMTVATKIDAPIKLMAPNPPGSASSAAILGLGDLAIPGLMVACLSRRGDALSDNGRSRLIGCGAYATGLVTTFLANEFVRRGQPALLYLVMLCVSCVCVCVCVCVSVCLVCVFDCLFVCVCTRTHTISLTQRLNLSPPPSLPPSLPFLPSSLFPSLPLRFPLYLGPRWRPHLLKAVLLPCGSFWCTKRQRPTQSDRDREKETCIDRDGRNKLATHRSRRWLRRRRGGLRQTVRVECRLEGQLTGYVRL